MSKGILSFSPGQTGYTDSIERYHFQKKLGTRGYVEAAKAMVGNWMLIYEPGGKRGGGRQAYLGIARVVSLDEGPDQNFFLNLEGQQFFA